LSKLQNEFIQLLAECVLMLESKSYKFHFNRVYVLIFRLLQVKREPLLMISSLGMFTGVWRHWERNFLCILIRKLWGKMQKKGFLCVQTVYVLGGGGILFLLMSVLEIW